MYIASTLLYRDGHGQNYVSLTESEQQGEEDENLGRFRSMVNIQFSILLDVEVSLLVLMDGIVRVGAV